MLIDREWFAIHTTSQEGEGDCGGRGGGSQKDWKEWKAGEGGTVVGQGRCERESRRNGTSVNGEGRRRSDGEGRV